MLRLPFVLRHLRARWSLVRTRAVHTPRGRIYRLHQLPAEVAERLRTGAPAVEPYAGLAAGWHAHFEPGSHGYGAYARFLVAEGIVRPEAALDLACGTGITTAKLAPLFATVVGMDSSPAMLAEARRNLAGSGNVDLVRGDFRDFRLDRTFDLITCSADALNYAQSPAELTAALTCAARALAPGGVLVFDLQAERLARVFEGVAIEWPGPGPSWLQVFRYDPSTRIDDSCVLWPEGVESHRRRIFTRSEVEGCARSAGLEPWDRFEGLLLDLLNRDRGRDFFAFRRMRP